MDPDGLWADEQLAPDLPVGTSRRDQGEDLPLAIREPMRIAAAGPPGPGDDPGSTAASPSIRIRIGGPDP